MRYNCEECSSSTRAEWCCGAKRRNSHGGGSLSREHFLLREMRLVAELRLQGKSTPEIVSLAKGENLFQYPTVNSVPRIARACARRLDALQSDELVELVARGAHDQAAQANLYGMARVFDIVYRLLLDEVAVRYRTLDYRFTRADMSAFLARYQAEREPGARLSESTAQRVASTLANSLLQAGMLSQVRYHALEPILLDPDLKRVMVANGDACLLPAFNCTEGA
ncbi:MULTISPECIES: DUF1819 family protein [unclassified Adlercreutzia]|uniref:DUF1819 family protein n=1 Tax=Adlercreutzia sp. ZJ305 TaxID=2709408 RepID=UPI0021069DF5|nr:MULTISPECIES: DUF1819 family protein [unclassified Adlercreutzia]